MKINEMLQTQNPAAADTSQTAPGITADALIEQLRTLNSQIPAVAPMTAQERQSVRSRARASQQVVKASISVIGANDLVSQALGQQSDAVQVLCDDSVRWQRAEDELRAMLNGVVGANLVRRQRLSALADRAYGIGVQLAKDPEHAALVPHVQEVKRLKKLERRKKPAPTSQTPPADTPTVPKGVE
jgi:hypothetical protein